MCNIIADCAQLGVLYIENAEIMWSVQTLMDRKLQNKREKNLSKSLCWKCRKSGKYEAGTYVQAKHELKL